jgi:hypothetical protein
LFRKLTDDSFGNSVEVFCLCAPQVTAAVAGALHVPAGDYNDDQIRRQGSAYLFYRSAFTYLPAPCIQIPVSNQREWSRPRVVGWILQPENACFRL